MFLIIGEKKSRLVLEHLPASVFIKETASGRFRPARRKQLLAGVW